ncbi:phenylalanine--tRNA ligase subunit beta [Nitratiruptor sp. YY09-18]|uniref:phenylalanine--tRNA ligase subunit beta n=1 Tax=Nitratiruptor sp. YY09-18 TaxID=2724901 RepID=UPI001914E274|nr:phenylalanine--tRNA ligase subunit beta [Nitratiruptor sp. YY09-18]BCD68347.1 phenylalanyl-tRNA synthetase beta chain [Nitratiruptor sp. YY09-18]
MIVTRNWLQEWIDISDIPTQKLIETLNSIGLEVAEVKKIDIPKNVVVGKIISCQKHPKADKLNVCIVDVGSEKLQIVCGAKNVVDAEYVAVAKIGAQLPGNFKIKPAKLRGVESFGMICSSTELGLPKLEDGIMILDSSIGELAIGRELREFPFFQDEIIDIELTANRGDCLSILGIAREFGVAFGKNIKEQKISEQEGVKVGIGRILNLDIEKNIESNLIYKAFEKKDFANPLAVRLRVAIAGENFANAAETLAFYITHSTGIITRIYSYRFFEENNAQIKLKKDGEYDSVWGKEEASVVGVIQFDSSKPFYDEEIFILEASYIDPQRIAKIMHSYPMKSDWVYYRSSRGSDPRLQIGIDYAKKILNEEYSATIYSGKHEITKDIERPAIKVDFDDLTKLIGVAIDKNSIVEILKRLGFSIDHFTEDSMVVKPPVYRHDIFNLQDIAEEIVRIYGIDKIEAKPLCFEEKNRINEAYYKHRSAKELRERAVACGYFETVSYLFTKKETLEKFHLPVIAKEEDLLNPITQEMDTLRTSLVPNMLEQVSTNLKNGYRSIKLFEIGAVFDSNRNESTYFTLIYSGLRENDALFNRGKPSAVTFEDITKDLGKILGDFTLERMEATNALMHPYQSAKVIFKEKIVGRVYKLHTQLQKELELPETFIAELNFDALDLLYPQANEYSVYQLALRDLSILIDKDTDFQKIRDSLVGRLPKEIKRFYPVDEYTSKDLGNKKSLTVRFAVQSDQKTLSEDEIKAIMDYILEILQKEVGASLR